MWSNSVNCDWRPGDRERRQDWPWTKKAGYILLLFSLQHVILSCWYAGFGLDLLGLDLV